MPKKQKPTKVPERKPALTFPSIHARRPQTSANYNTLGLAFQDTTGTGVMDLTTFMGAAATATINQAGQIIFHMMGDSGVNSAAQAQVAEAMAGDINNTNHELGPSFMVHLGDVIYGANKQAEYADKFYRIYDRYDRLIFAVPGNHDGEVFPSTDPVTLAAFTENFCATGPAQPPLAKEFGFLMPQQPGPYWHLQAPFIDIIGLYSNQNEDLGIIFNQVVGPKQKAWLQARLTAIAKARTTATRKALVIAVHHPPYARGFKTTGAGHPGNPQMLGDIDACCTAAGILPDAVIAGHTHSYQHYVRTQTLNGQTCTIPYLIVGTGGIAIQSIPTPTGVKDSTGLVLYYSAFQDYGYLTATASNKQLKLVFTSVTGTQSQVREQITVDLTKHQIV